MQQHFPRQIVVVAAPSARPITGKTGGQDKYKPGEITELLNSRDKVKRREGIEAISDNIIALEHQVCTSHFEDNRLNALEKIRQIADPELRRSTLFYVAMSSKHHDVGAELIKEFSNDTEALKSIASHSFNVFAREKARQILQGSDKERI